MTKIYHDSDADLSVLRGKKIAVIGYGNQGRAQAMCLHDSGMDVVVGARKGGESWERVQEDGLKVAEIPNAVKGADVVMILLPDENIPQVYNEEVAPNLKKGAALAFAHGFNVHYNQVVPRDDVDVIMVAPKGPGHTVRSEYLKGGGVPSLIAVYQDKTGKAKDIALSYAAANGGTKGGVIETNFREETETDLFGEQVDLCGGLSSLIKTAFEVLVEVGYQPEMAYFETCHEVKLIVDLIYEGGLERMWHSVSNTAEYGGMTVGPRVINEYSREAMYEALERIQNGEFAKEFVLEGMVNHPVLKAMERQEKEHQLEVVGKQIRANIPWLNKKIDDD